VPLTRAHQSVKNSVVQVLALNGPNIVGSGSGSIVDTGKTVLTCAHCIIAGAQMSIADPNTPGRAIFGNVVVQDIANDVALIEFPSVIGTPVRFANSLRCEIGNGAFVVGYPMGVTEQVLLSAHIASLTNSGIRIDASVNHGNSGGPLFNLAGEQIGVVNAKHGSLSAYLNQIKNSKPGSNVFLSGIDPITVLQKLIEEMQINLNLGIGYAIPTALLRTLHTRFEGLIP
jgi:S1-C subfamily serine protease